MVQFEQVSFGFKKKPLFNELSLRLNTGSIYGLLGKNGAGKTTFLNLLTGLLFPQSGTIEVLGNEPRKRSVELLSELFLIPEEFDMPRVSMTEYAKLYGSFYPRFDEKQLKEYLSVMEVDGEQNLQKMSFGQRKKAFIAFALACNTKLLVMDEPTNGLDIPSKGNFRKLLSMVLDEERTVIISTHQVRDLDQMIDAVVIVDEGKIQLNATVEEITRKLCFKHLQPSDHALYQEPTIHGSWGICVNEASEESPLDMELLFNAVIAQREQFVRLFEQK